MICSTYICDNCSSRIGCECHIWAILTVFQLPWGFVPNVIDRHWSTPHLLQYLEYISNPSPMQMNRVLVHYPKNLRMMEHNFEGKGFWIFSFWFSSSSLIVDFIFIQWIDNVFTHWFTILIADTFMSSRSPYCKYTSLPLSCQQPKSSILIHEHHIEGVVYKYLIPAITSCTIEFNVGVCPSVILIYDWQ